MKPAESVSPLKICISILKRLLCQHHNFCKRPLVVKVFLYLLNYCYEYKHSKYP